MLTGFPICLMVGSILGFLSGIGVGGGSLLMLWLTLVQGMGQENARSINLLFFLPAAVVSLLLRRRKRPVSYKNALPAMIAGAGCAALFTVMSRSWDTQLLQKAFGVLLLLTGARELSWKAEKNRAE